MPLTQEQTKLINTHMHQNMSNVEGVCLRKAHYFSMGTESTIYTNTYKDIVDTVIENVDNRYSDEMKGTIVAEFKVAVRDATINGTIKYRNEPGHKKHPVPRPVQYHHEMALRLLENYWELYQAIVEKNEPEKFLNHFKQSYQQLLIDYKDRDAFYKHSEKLLNKIQRTIQQPSDDIIQFKQLRRLQTYLNPIDHGMNVDNKIENVTRHITTYVSDVLNANEEDDYSSDLTDQISQIISVINVRETFNRDERNAVLNILREQLSRLPKDKYALGMIESGQMHSDLYHVLSLINETDEQVFQSAFQTFATSFAISGGLGSYEKQALDQAQKDNPNNQNILKIIAFLAEPPSKPVIKTEQTEPNVSKGNPPPSVSESRPWYARIFQAFLSMIKSVFQYIGNLFYSQSSPDIKTPAESFIPPVEPSTDTTQDILGVLSRNDKQVNVVAEHPCSVSETATVQITLNANDTPPEPNKDEAMDRTSPSPR